MQRKADAEAEKRKGFTVTIDGEPINLPLVYGYQKVGGVRTYHATRNSYTQPALQSGFQRFAPNFPPSGSASTPQYLVIQQALCFGGIDAILDIEVDSQNWDDPTFRHSLDFSLNGSVANAKATANGVPATNRFTNVAYLTGIFDLNRDDPQYNGVPEVAAYIRGNRINTVEFFGGAYTLSATKVFNNNPAYVLLDYLLRPKLLGGCGYSVNDVDLASFYNAAQICDTVVDGAVPVKGRVNGVRPVAEGETPASATRALHLYECNLTLDTNETRRDNIERILETMAQSELIWSEGRYKLILDYPSSEAAQNALITASYTDENIVNSQIEIVWAGVQNRFNRATVKFLNEEQDFATDSVSWPVYGSAGHVSYLADDNNIESEIEYFIQGATHRRSALAKAEELVRNSRISKIINIELNREAFIHEQGDLISISSASAGIVNEVYRIEEISITPALSVKISAVRFDYTTLAYNVDDSYITNPKIYIPTGVPNVTGLTWNEGSRVGGLSNGWLSWTAPSDETVRRYLIYYRTVGGNYLPLGESRTTYFDIPSELSDGTDFFFLVRTENARGRLSEGAIILLDQLALLVPVTDAFATAGINSVTLSWNNPSPELVLRYDIYRSLTNDRGSATLIASSTTFSATIAPLAITDHYFWIDTIGRDGAIALMSSSVFVSALSLGITTADVPALEAIEQFMTDSVFLQAADGGASSELELATYSDGTIDVSTARISADAILLNGSVSANQLTITELSGNQMANGNFAFGDLRGWESDGDGTWGVIERGSMAPTAVMTMPSAFAIYSPASPVTNTHFRQTQTFACVAGDRFTITYRYAAMGATRSVSGGTQIMWLDALGATISTQEVAFANSTAETWTSSAPTAVVAPAGALYARVRIYVLAGSVGQALFTDIRCERQRAGSIVLTPNSITGAQLVQTEALITNAAQIQNGVISNAKIGDAQINNAKIANLTVGGEKIQNSAITSAAAAYGASGALPAAWTTITQFWAGTEGGRTFIAWAQIEPVSGTGGQGTSGFGQIRMLVNGSVVYNSPNIATDNFPILRNATSGYGSTHVVIQGIKTGGDGSFTATAFIVGMEFKK